MCNVPRFLTPLAACPRGGANGNWRSLKNPHEKKAHETVLEALLPLRLRLDAVGLNSGDLQKP